MSVLGTPRVCERGLAVTPRVFVRGLAVRPRFFGRVFARAPSVFVPGLLFCVCFGLLGCNDAYERLERKLLGAQARLQEMEALLEDASQLAASQAELTRQLPGPPRGALTASVAAALRGLQVEIDATPKLRRHAMVLQEPILLVCARDQLWGVYQRLSKLGRPWQLDSVRLDPRIGMYVIEMHSFLFSGLPTAASPLAALEVGADENSFGSTDRDAVRAQIRAALRKIKQHQKTLQARLGSAAAVEAVSAARHRTQTLQEIRRKTQRARGDTELILRALTQTKIQPELFSLAVRRGRKVCQIVVPKRADRARLASAAVALGAVTDVERSELVLKSGRVCKLLKTRPPMRRRPGPS